MKKLATICALLIAALSLGFAISFAQDAKDEEASQNQEAESEAAEPIELGSSWRDQAVDAWSRGDMDDAIYHYRRWLEADPQDDWAWYNLACAYAVTDKLEKAQWAIDRAAAAGWKDYEHTKGDKDLDPLRETDAFKRTMQAIEANATRGQPENMERRFLKMVSTGTYIVLLPSDYNEGHEKDQRTYPMCLLLHGHGSTEIGHAGMGKMVGRDDVIFICPRAPHPVAGVFAEGNPGYSAWPPERTDEQFDYPMKLYVDFIAACAEDARKHYRIDHGKCYALGHSQGGGACNALAMLYPDMLESYYSYAGYFDEKLFEDDDGYKTIAKSGVNVWLGHCEEDPVVSVEEQRSGFERLFKYDANVTGQFFEGGSHRIVKDAQESIKKWADWEILGGKHKK